MDSAIDQKRAAAIEAKRQERINNPFKKSPREYEGKVREFRGSHLQDLFILEVFFPNRTGGTFFECGALDGEYISNTCVLEKEFGWSGVLVEPLTSQFEKLQVNRPNSKCYNACVGPENSAVLFFNMRDGGLSGIVKEIGRRQIERYESSYMKNPAAYERNPGQLKLEWKQVINTTQAILQAGYQHIDFFSLDVEGGEHAVLSGLDIAAVSVKVFCVEANPQSKEQTNAWMQERGYTAVATHAQDIFYAHKDFIAQLEAERGSSLADSVKASRVKVKCLL